MGASEKHNAAYHGVTSEERYAEQAHAPKTVEEVRARAVANETYRAARDGHLRHEDIPAWPSYALVSAAAFLAGLLAGVLVF